MQNGLGDAGKAAVVEAHTILRKHGIDPFYSKKCLAWAPNWGHPDQYAIDALEMLKKADKIGLSEVEDSL